MRRGTVPKEILQDVIEAVRCRACLAPKGERCRKYQTAPKKGKLPWFRALPVWSIHPARVEAFIKHKGIKAAEIAGLTKAGHRRGCGLNNGGCYCNPIPPALRKMKGMKGGVR